jgi:DNA-binding response OmpR family regulator
VLSRILIIDDDEDLCSIMSELLLMSGIKACVVARSYEELEAQRAAALECGIAIVDVNLGPGRKSGLDVYNWLRAEGFGGKIIFLTGHALTHPLVSAAAHTPNTQVLAKPIGISELQRLAGVQS